LRLVDCDAWIHDELSLSALSKWLKLYQQIDHVQAFERFKQLDEEYQLALLGPMISIIDQEELEKLGTLNQDQYIALPGHQLFYRIATDSTELSEMIENLIGGGLSSNIEYTLSLLAHSYYLPPGEQEALIKQFRDARLEEDGFVSTEEAYSFIDTKGQDLEKIYANAVNTQSTAIDTDAAMNSSKTLIEEQLAVFSQAPLRTNLLDRTLAKLASNAEQYETAERIKTSLLQLTNALSSLVHLDPGNQDGLSELLTRSSALLNLGLEHICQQNENLALPALTETSAKTLFRVGLKKIHDLNASLVKSLIFLDSERYQNLEKYFNRQQYSLVEKELDNLFIELGLQETEILKAAFRLFPELPIQVEASDSNVERFRFIPISTTDEYLALKELFNNIYDLIRQASSDKKIIH
ncbi:MAG: hypothetical protein KBD78_12085, partial [Oligoflexales bacterium]|nr:hypothetical protein [Oligoflexales bacterium]